MPKRIQSPSSINTFKQCPRKYFYQYIVKHPTKENIHCIRGNIVHSALEDFFKLNPTMIDPIYYKKELSRTLKDLFDMHWKKAGKRLQKVGLLDEQLTFYYTDSTHMLANFLNAFFKQMDLEMGKLEFKQAFDKLKPYALEKQYKNMDLMVRGFIDVIEKEGEEIRIVDYKTSKTSQMKPEYKLQLGIYALMYEREHGRYPDKVGVWFLKDKLKMLDVTPQLVKDAEFEIEQIHFATENADTINEYRKKKSPLCKYSTGQCDFYDICKRDD
jgi:RecB family exonuclease